MFKNLIARFTSGQMALGISAKNGKKAIAVRVVQRVPNTKPVIGCRGTFALDEDGQKAATARFTALVAEAQKKGWTPKAGRQTVDAFSSIPSVLPEAEKTADKPDTTGHKLVAAGGKR